MTMLKGLGQEGQVLGGAAGRRGDKGPFLLGRRIERLEFGRCECWGCTCSYDTGHMWEASSPQPVLACLMRL